MTTTIAQNEVRETLLKGGHSNALIDSYVQFAESRLGPDWISLFGDKNELLEDVDLFIEANALEVNPPATT